MSYDTNILVRHYSFGTIDWGAGADIVHTIAVPQVGSQGRAGRVVDIIIAEVTEDFAGSTLDAGVEIGDGTDPNLYYDTGRVGLDETVDTGDDAVLSLPDTRTGTAIVPIELARSTITVTFKVSTGSPTGQAVPTIVVEWF